MSKSKSKTTKMTKTFNEQALENAMALAAKMQAEGQGPCAIVRTVSRQYSSLPRKDVLTACIGVGIDAGTAARQFFLTRSGQV